MKEQYKKLVLRRERFVTFGVFAVYSYCVVYSFVLFSVSKQRGH